MKRVYGATTLHSVYGAVTMRFLVDWFTARFWGSKFLSWLPEQFGVRSWACCMIKFLMLLAVDHICAGFVPQTRRHFDIHMLK
jgi:hypothetical protein